MNACTHDSTIFDDECEAPGFYCLACNALVSTNARQFPEPTEPMLATPRNMRQVAGQGNVLAWSPDTGEGYSATPGDYWDMNPDSPLLDELGEPMILVRREVRMIPLEVSA